MQVIMEPVFETAYLIGVIALGLLTIKRGENERQFAVFGIMAIVLGCGDAFHLIPRMWALITSGRTDLPEYAAALGFGKLVTSVTMTVFYVLLFHFWRLRYGNRSGALLFSVYFLAAARTVLCLMPQNEWLSPGAPLEWGIIRNIPFVILGSVTITLFFWKAREDKQLKRMWVAAALSFLFYIPVVLFADALPVIGALMVPKTCAYFWIVWMGFTTSRRYKAAPPLLR